MRKAMILLAACSMLVPAAARTSKQQPSTPGKFKEFRDKMLGNYKDYRDKVLDNYDKFLDGVWTEMATFKGEEYNPKPKPKHVPELKQKETPVVLPVPDMPTPDSSEPSSAPEKAPSTPERAATPSAATGTPLSFDYHGMQMQLPAVSVSLMGACHDKTDFAEQWRNLARADFAGDFISAVRKLSDECKLNDYLTFDLLMSYAGRMFPDVDSSSRASFVHFMLNNMGYDARLGITDSGVTMLMLPLKQKIFARAFMEIDGQRYYVFTDDKHTPADIGGYINTCQLPRGVDAGSHFDLTIPDGLNLPYKAHTFEVNYGGMQLKGEVNANLMPLLYRYPQMPMGDYASSTLMPSLREDLVRQVKSQLSGMTQLDAVNTLLGFIQSGFEYATDEEQHGFEKPYFLEETLYYPKCDCEDRAVMYGYLLSKALGVENHLIFYPGHESVAVTLDSDIEGDNYVYKGKRYMISDPTFIGAATGVCMPQYKTTTPKIDYVYR